MILLTGIVVSQAMAVSPPFVSDRSLAEAPFVVVARWDGAPFIDASVVKGNWEVQTQIVIERVIKGDINVGKHTILVGYAIGWSKEQPWVMSYTSTQMRGDCDATKPSLWFLQRKRSMIATDTTNYLFLATYRGIQPLELAPYFKALNTKHPTAHVLELLHTDNDAIQLRTLELVAGHRRPWPYDFRFAMPEHVLNEQAEIVRSLIQRTDSASVRRFAMAVYGHLKGKESLGFMQQQLTNTDSHIRGIAVGTLAHHKASKAIESMAKSVVGVDDPNLASKVIERLRDWKDLEVVPVLIPFLQNDGQSYAIGDDLGLPAIKAQQAIRDITGYMFPFDVGKSEIAWMAVRHMRDRTERNEVLARILPNDPSPWKARIFVQNRRVMVEVTNQSSMAFTLSRLPSRVTLRYSAGVFISDSKPKVNKSDFVSLNSGESVRFDLSRHGNSYDELARHNAECILQYTSNGNNVGVNSWLGTFGTMFGNE